MTANRWQHLAIAMAMILFAAEDVLLGRPIRAVICGGFAVGCIVMALFPIGERDL